MGKVIKTVQLSPTLVLSECTDGYWLWDKVVEMNLAMRAKTEQEAILNVIRFYHTYYPKVNQDYKELKSKVDMFISNFVDDHEVNNVL